MARLSTILSRTATRMRDAEAVEAAVRTRSARPIVNRAKNRILGRIVGKLFSRFFRYRV